MLKIILMNFIIQEGKIKMAYLKPTKDWKRTICIDFDGGEQTCSGPGDCYHYTDDSGCTSYPE